MTFAFCDDQEVISKRSGFAPMLLYELCPWSQQQRHKGHRERASLLDTGGEEEGECDDVVETDEMNVVGVESLYCTDVVVWKAHGGRKSQGRLFTSKTMAVLMIRTSGSVFDSNSRKRGRYIAFTSVMHDGSDIGTVWQVRKPHSDEHSRPQKNQKLPNKTSESAW